MEMEIMNAISTVGFPITMCLLMGWYIMKVNASNQEMIQKIEENHLRECADMRATVESNTNALLSLSNEISKLKEGN